jgi:hypothetical protein
MGKHAKPGGVFACAACIRFAAFLPAEANQDVHEAADMLVLLDAQRVRESSQNTYASSLHRFASWATMKAKIPIDQVLPPSKAGAVPIELVRLFMAWATTRYKASTIESTLSAIKDWHKSKRADYSHLCTEEIKQLLHAIKVNQGPEGLPKGKVGMTKPILRVLLKYLMEKIQTAAGTPLEHLHLRDLTWILLGFYGMMRRSELIALRIEDVTVGKQNGVDYVELNIRKSKTDQRGQGAQVSITGLTKDGIRIAHYVSAWLRYRTAHGAVPEDALIVAWDLDSRSLSPTTPIKTGQALAERLKLHLRDVLQRFPGLQVNPNAYGMHSLRRGGVMAAWHAGIPVEKIKDHGRWKSDAIRAYMHTTRSMRLQVTHGM